MSAWWRSGSSWVSTCQQMSAAPRSRRAWCRLGAAPAVRQQAALPVQPGDRPPKDPTPLHTSKRRPPRRGDIGALLLGLSAAPVVHGRVLVLAETDQLGGARPRRASVGVRPAPGGLVPARGGFGRASRASAPQRPGRVGAPPLVGRQAVAEAGARAVPARAKPPLEVSDRHPPSTRSGRRGRGGSRRHAGARQRRGRRGQPRCEPLAGRGTRAPPPYPAPPGRARDAPGPTRRAGPGPRPPYLQKLPLNHQQRRGPVPIAGDWYWRMANLPMSGAATGTELAQEE
jgi:hypothetical protein